MLSGKKYGRYEIRHKIGAGGMGEVYSAYDEELNRNIALKILNSDFSVDEFKKSRFRREARAVSALNHPNIITIYEIGENDGDLFIATELIDGKTLRELIREAPLPLTQTLKIATQISDALVAAHTARIVHRDIKPENVMVRHDGYVKVLDFGLAKTTIETDDLSTDEIIKTTPGMVIGSVRYMSPEQARGVKIDERTDIWSLGIVLFEMLTGKAPFDGATTSDTLANVIYKEPKSILEINPNAPPELDKIISKSLNKKIEDRYQTSKEFSTDLHNLLSKIEHEISFESQKTITPPDWIISENPTILHQTASANHPTQISSIPPQNSAEINASTLPPTETVSVNKPRSVFKLGLFGIGALILLSAVGFAAFKWFGTKSDSFVKSFEKTQISRLNSDGKVRLSAMSPDGKYIAYVSGEVGNRSLVVRQIATGSTVTAVPSNVLDFRTLAFSPDGNHILYTQSGKDFTVNTLYQVPTLGGNPKKLIEDVDSMPTFSPDGKRFAFIRHVSNGGMDLLLTANADGTDIKTVLSSKDTTFDFINTPAWFPQSDKILVSAGNIVGGVNRGNFFVEISTTDKSFRKINDKQWWQVNDIVWYQDGTGIFISAREKEDAPNQIWRVAYPSGESKPITNDLNNYFNLGVSQDNTTLIAVKSDSVYSIWNFSIASKTQNQIISDSPNFEGAAGICQTPDGKIIYTRRDGKNTHLWISEADGKNPKQLTSETADDFNPVVSPDGKYIVFSSDRSGTNRIWRIEIDGKNPKQLTEESPLGGDYNPVITADSQNVIYNDAYSGDKQPSKLLKVSIDGGKSSIIYSNEALSIYLPQLSPDNKTLAFTAYNTSNFEKKLYLNEFDGNQVGKEIKTFEYNLVNKYFWSPDGKSMTYLSVDGVPNIWKISLDGNDKQQLTNYSTGRISNVVWSKEGKQLLISRPIVNNDLILIKDSTIEKTQ